MTDYAKLIKALRICGHASGCPEFCPRYRTYEDGLTCAQYVIFDAADALEAAEHRIEDLEGALAACRIRKDGRIPKEGEWLRTDAFPHRVYCSCCYKTYVPNENWQIWQDDADNFGLPRNYCPNCGAKMKTVTDCHTLEEGEHDGET